LNLHHRGDRGCTQAQGKAARSCPRITHCRLP
jgi:hypothetical protein